jgi:hypothetical protein
MFLFNELLLAAHREPLNDPHQRGREQRPSNDVKLASRLRCMRLLDAVYAMRNSSLMCFHLSKEM